MLIFPNIFKSTPDDDFLWFKTWPLDPPREPCDTFMMHLNSCLRKTTPPSMAHCPRVFRTMQRGGIMFQVRHLLKSLTLKDVMVSGSTWQKYAIVCSLSMLDVWLLLLWQYRWWWWWWWRWNRIVICTATKCLAKLWIIIVARGPSRGSYMIRIVFFRASKVYSCPFEVHPGFAHVSCCLKNINGAMFQWTSSPGSAKL